MKKIKGPAVFLAQFLRDAEPYNTVSQISKWFAGMGYKGLQIPTWDKRAIDLNKAASSKSYCEDYKGLIGSLGLEVAELSAHLQGQVLAMHPAYEDMFAGFYPEGFKDSERFLWATDQLKKTITASYHLGLSNVAVLSGGFAWHTVYPWPQRPQGLIEEAFKELSNRWKPVLNFAADHGITIGYELHPGSDLFDGFTYERFLEETGQHPAACLTYDPSHFLLQQLDYLQFIDFYHERIKSFHVKDAEFLPNGKTGVYGGYQPWLNRAGRFRSLGDGQIDFQRIFSALTKYGYEGWAIMEWECCLKSPEQGAAEGAPFISRHIIEVTQVAFDDFAGAGISLEKIRKILGLTNK
jgi:sugar phosphate isomerase/epimerase